MWGMRGLRHQVNVPLYYTHHTCVRQHRLIEADIIEEVLGVQI